MKNQSNQLEITRRHTLPAFWAGVLIRNDWEDVDLREAAQLEDWLDDNNLSFCLSVPGCVRANEKLPIFTKAHDAIKYYPNRIECFSFTFTIAKRVAA